MVRKLSWCINVIYYVFNCFHTETYSLPARTAQLDKVLDLKLAVVGSIHRLVNLTNINCLSDETLN